MRLSDINVNAHGLSKEEIQEALDSKYQYKNFKIVDYEEHRKGLVKEIGLLLAQLDNEFAADMLAIIKEHHPNLLNNT